MYGITWEHKKCGEGVCLLGTICPLLELTSFNFLCFSLTPKWDLMELPGTKKFKFLLNPSITNKNETLWYFLVLKEYGEGGRPVGTTCHLMALKRR